MCILHFRPYIHICCLVIHHIMSYSNSISNAIGCERLIMIIIMMSWIHIIDVRVGFRLTRSPDFGNGRPVSECVFETQDVSSFLDNIFPYTVHPKNDAFVWLHIQCIPRIMLSLWVLIMALIYTQDLWKIHGYWHMLYNSIFFQRFGVSTGWSISVLVCRHFGLSTFRFVEVCSVVITSCRRFRLSMQSLLWICVCLKQTKTNKTSSTNKDICGMGLHINNHPIVLVA